MVGSLGYLIHNHACLEINNKYWIVLYVNILQNYGTMFAWMPLLGETSTKLYPIIYMEIPVVGCPHNLTDKYVEYALAGLFERKFSEGC